MNWDEYFHSICEAVASKSPCLSRKIGSIIVRDNSIISTGYNGPPRGIPHCGYDRIFKDNILVGEFKSIPTPKEIDRVCPRKALGYVSGTHMELCPAQHAEVNAISNAARLGVSVLGATLYLNTLAPCKNCLGTIINAGIVEIVCDDISRYDRLSEFILDNSKLILRGFTCQPVKTTHLDSYLK